MTKRGYLCLYCGQIRAETMFDVGNDRCHECIKEGRSAPIWHEADGQNGYVAGGRNER